ncbi:MAG: hypothetical protein KKI09_01940 [Spirochaetes bacterium]|nr:hypothetical protein [Spirochaetota bacterium]
MKKKLLLAGLCLFTSMAYGQTANEVLVLRRVFTAPLQIESFIIPAESEAFTYRLPAMLFSAIAELQPCVPVSAQDTAHSRLHMLATGLPEGLMLTAAIIEQDKELVRNSIVLSDLLSQGKVIQQFILETAKKFAPYVLEVPQQVNREQVILSSRRQQVEEDISFELAASSRYEIGFSLVGPLLAYGQPEIHNNSTTEIYPLALEALPLILDFAIYKEKSDTAFLLGLLIDSNAYQSFFSRDTILDQDAVSGRIWDIEKLDLVPSNNIITMIGIGFRYRSLGRLSASFTALLYGGSARIELLEPVHFYYQPDADSDYVLLEYPAGDIRWLPLSYLNFGLGFYYNITPKIYAGVSVEMLLNPLIVLVTNNRRLPYLVSTSPVLFKLPGLVAGIRF